MSRVVKYPGQVDFRIDSKVCRITEMAYTIEKNLLPQFRSQYKNDRVLQIKVKDIENKEFLVLQSLLEPLNEVLVINAEN